MYRLALLALAACNSSEPATDAPTEAPTTEDAVTDVTSAEAPAPQMANATVFARRGRFSLTLTSGETTVSAEAPIADGAVRTSDLTAYSDAEGYALVILESWRSDVPALVEPLRDGLFDAGRDTYVELKLTPQADGVHLDWTLASGAAIGGLVELQRTGEMSHPRLDTSPLDITSQLSAADRSTLARAAGLPRLDSIHASLFLDTTSDPIQTGRTVRAPTHRATSDHDRPIWEQVPDPRPLPPGQRPQGASPRREGMPPIDAEELIRRGR